MKRQRGILTSTIIGLALSVSQANSDFNSVKLEFGYDPIQIQNQSELAQAKKFQMSGEWTKCLSVLKKEYPKQTELQPWILISWLSCAKQDFKKNSKASIDLQPILLARAKKNWMLDPIFGPSLFDAWVEMELLLAKSRIDKKMKEKNISLEELFAYKEKLSKAQRAQWLELTGDQSQIQGHVESAIDYYELSLSELEQKSIREKLQKLVKIDQSGLSDVKDKTTKLGADNIVELKEAKSETIEGGFEERFRLVEKSLDSVVSVQDLVQYLVFYPAGQRSNWAFQKIQDIVGSLDNWSDESIRQTFQKILMQIEKLDNDRALEILRTLHRRQSYAQAHELAKKLSDRKSFGKSLAIVFYIGGRSAQFLSDYQSSKDFFENYTQHFASADDIVEVYFRLGLVNYRLKNYSSANAAFERLLNLPSNIERYELNTRYWLVRCLQQQKNPRASEEIQKILEKYPFSYYGLKLKSESEANQISWPTELAGNRQIKKEYRWLASQEKSFQIFKKLALNGWIKEARQEMSRIVFTKKPEDLILMAEKSAQAGLYPQAIRWLSDAGDEEAGFRSMNLVQLGFPDVYRDEIQQQADRHFLSPILIKSLIRQESAFDVWAVSSSQALGLMQMIPSTAKDVANELAITDLKIPEDMFNPARNIQMGVYYINKRVRQYQGNVPMALAAYNAGATRLKNFFQRPELQKQIQDPSTLPEDEIWYDELPFFETSFYVKAILRNSLIYKMLQSQSGSLIEVKPVTLPPVLWSDLVFSPKTK